MRKFEEDRERDDAVTAKALVKVTLEIEITSRWGADTTIAQIEKQARDEVVERLQHKQLNYRIVGDHEVTAVLVRTKT